MISGFRVLTDQKELFGLVASVPTVWRTLDEIAAGGPRALTRITKAVHSARRQAWALIEARHGAQPGVRIADKILPGLYRSFRGLLGHLATLTRNQVRFTGTHASTDMLTEPTSEQRQAFDLIGAPIQLILK